MGLLRGEALSWWYNAAVTYEWDDAKRASNLVKHGVDFADVARFDFAGAVAEIEERRGEVRYVATGYIDDRIHKLVYVMRGGSIRVISLRKANNRERSAYHERRG